MRKIPLVLLEIVAFALLANAQKADFVLYNAKVVTVDPAFHIVDSIAVNGDRILATGSRGEVAKFTGPKTRKIDLNGKSRPFDRSIHVRI